MRLNNYGLLQRIYIYIYIYIYIFNQKSIHRLTLLTGALRPHTCKYDSMIEISDMKKWTGADPVACFLKVTN